MAVLRETCVCEKMAMQFMIKTEPMRPEGVILAAEGSLDGRTHSLLEGEMPGESLNADSRQTGRGLHQACWY